MGDAATVLSRAVAREQSLGRRKLARRQGSAVIINGRWPCEPHLVFLWMVHDVLQGLTERAQAVGLTDDHRVQGDAADQRLLGRLTEQLLELADDEVP